MKFAADHDFHIHTRLSSCSRDERQTPHELVRYGERNGFKTLCVANHFWDDAVPGASEWYGDQGFANICRDNPLPQGEDVRLLFGCECEMDRFGTVAITPERCKSFDFVIVPVTHLHMHGFTISEDDGKSPESRARHIVKRLGILLKSDLPRGKTGLAHITDRFVAGSGATIEESQAVLRLVKDGEWGAFFEKAAKAGLGIELNIPVEKYSGADMKELYRPYLIAKECGAKFYLGSDAHHPEDLELAPARFAKVISDLGLAEEDKFLLR